MLTQLVSLLWVSKPFLYERSYVVTGNINMITKYDQLYSYSLNSDNFYKLMDMIGSEENIRLAYRNIKTNKGSKTAGVYGLTIKDIWHLNDTQVVKQIRKR